MDGKLFERKVLRSLQGSGFLPIRQHDAYTHRNGVDYGTKTPFDFLAIGRRRGGVSVIAIEAKVVDGDSIPFSRLEPHQLTGLSGVESYSRCCHGYVAVCFYDGMDPRCEDMYLIPVDVWESLSEGERRSIPRSVCEAREDIIHCPVKRGVGYDLSGLHAAVV